jgi:acylphosphatase
MERGRFQGARIPVLERILQVRTLHLRIFGRVQGVGFREALCRECERLGVTGWVRNRRDGSVEALVQAEGAALEAVLDWSRRGPPAARVERVDSGPPPVELSRVYARFERWPTA